MYCIQTLATRAGCLCWSCLRYALDLKRPPGAPVYLIGQRHHMEDGLDEHFGPFLPLPPASKTLRIETRRMQGEINRDEKEAEMMQETLV